MQVAVKIRTQIVELFLELVDIMLNSISQHLFPLGGAATGISNQAGSPTEYHYGIIASQAKMIKNQEAHIVPYVNAV